MKKREGKDIWQGLYDFYLIEKKRNQKLERIIREDELLASATIGKKSKIYKHILSHQKLIVRFVELQLPSTKRIIIPALKWFTNRQIAALPKPILIANYLKEA